MNQLSNSIKLGDVFVLGEHILACGDARDSELITKIIGIHKIKAVILDPPYGVAVTESKRGFQNLAKDKVITNDHLQSDAEYREFTKAWLEPILPHLERKNNFYIFNADKMVFALREGMQDVGIKFGQLLIWVKTHAVVGRMDYAPQHELIAYGWYGVHEFVKAKDKSVLICPKPNQSKMHPTTKPLDLIRRLVLNSTRIGDVVFDSFLGSGTTLLACEQTKRNCIGVELDPEYCSIIIARFEKLTGIKAKPYEQG
ncbi:MAG: site-specific DNA-methyltransferase [Candidatus Pacebacteria bacterium]|nr:site-specific DNA-methyltransferase [Candidatus Paceibacterota bacterium]MCF7857518.1 site-specific DNA-methyltransferase [Candidatus Paceibacterota bacterium]